MAVSFQVTDSGSWKGLDKMLKEMAKPDIAKILTSAGDEGVAALRSATPADSGATANSWAYRVKMGGGKATVTWYNTNTPGGFEVAMGLQYGHGTGTGGYVQGRDYINPAMRPVFDSIADRAWKAVTGK